MDSDGVTTATAVYCSPHVGIAQRFLRLRRFCLTEAPFQHFVAQCKSCLETRQGECRSIAVGRGSTYIENPRSRSAIASPTPKPNDMLLVLTGSTYMLSRRQQQSGYKSNGILSLVGGHFSGDNPKLSRFGDESPARRVVHWRSRRCFKKVTYHPY
jgi:hypothetical protein